MAGLAGGRFQELIEQLLAEHVPWHDVVRGTSLGFRNRHPRRLGEVELPNCRLRRFPSVTPEEEEVRCLKEENSALREQLLNPLSPDDSVQDSGGDPCWRSGICPETVRGECKVKSKGASEPPDWFLLHRVPWGENPNFGPEKKRLG